MNFASERWLAIGHFSLAPLPAGLLALAAALSASANQAPNPNRVLLDAMSPYEDAIEAALSRSSAAISVALTGADRRAADVKSALAPPASDEFARLLANLHGSASHNNHHETTITCVQIFGLLNDNLRPEGLQGQKEIGWLDYAGFKLLVLADAPAPHWEDIHRMVVELFGRWRAVKPHVRQPDLRDAFDGVIRRLADAVLAKDLEVLRADAKAELDLVDRIEDEVAR